MAKPIAVTQADFDSKVLNSSVPVVVDFWAPWCGPCRQIAPILEELAGEYDGKLTIAKVNTDEQMQLAGKYQIQGIPALLIFKDGKEVERLVGSRPKSALRTAIDQAVG